MKKLIAVILAVMMLGSVAAFADNDVFTLSDPVLDVFIAGQGSQTFDFTGMSIAVSPVVEDENVTFVLNVLANGEPALVAAAKLVGERVFMSMEGLSNTYFAEIPVQEVVSATNDIDLSGIDVEALITPIMNELEITTEGNTTYFKLPYTALNSVLETLAPVIGEALSSQGVDVSEFENAIAELKQSNSGVNLEGSFSSLDASTSMNFAGYLVQNGEASSTALFSVTGNFSDEDDAAFGNLDMSVSTDGGEPQLIVAFSFNIEKEAGNVFLRMFFAPANTSLSIGYNAEPSMVKIGLDMDENSFDLSFIVDKSEGELAVCPLDEAGALNVQELSDEQMQQLQNEAVQAISPLLSIVSQVVG